LRIAFEKGQQIAAVALVHASDIDRERRTNVALLSELTRLGVLRDVGASADDRARNVLGCAHGVHQRSFLR
jgi:hypothetical protein